MYAAHLNLTSERVPLGNMAIHFDIGGSNFAAAGYKWFVGANISSPKPFSEAHSSRPLSAKAAVERMFGTEQNQFLATNYPELIVREIFESPQKAEASNCTLS